MKTLEQPKCVVSFFKWVQVLREDLYKEVWIITIENILLNTGIVRQKSTNMNNFSQILGPITRFFAVREGLDCSVNSIRSLLWSSHLEIVAGGLNTYHQSPPPCYYRSQSSHLILEYLQLRRILHHGLPSLGPYYVLFVNITTIMICQSNDGQSQDRAPQ